MTKALFVLAALLVILLLVAGLFLASQSGQRAGSPDRARLVAAASPQTVPLDAQQAFPEINTWDSISFPYDSGGIAVYSWDSVRSFSEDGVSRDTSRMRADVTVPPDRMAQVNELRSLSRDGLIIRIRNSPSPIAEEAIARASRICLLGMQLAASTDQAETGGCRRFEFSQYPEAESALFWELRPDSGCSLRADEGFIYRDWGNDDVERWLPMRFSAGDTFVRGAGTFKGIQRQSIVLGGDVFRCWYCTAEYGHGDSIRWIAPGIGEVYRVMYSRLARSVQRVQLKELFLLKSRTYWRHPDATHD